MSHLLEAYSLMSSSKISAPFILEKFFPLPLDRYITFQPQSKYPSKNYDLWEDVLEILAPILKEHNIGIIQIGGPGERPYPHCYHTQSKTSLNQAAYIIKRGLLHLGVDSVGVHYAGAFDKPIVALYSNNYINCVKSYWGDISKQILLEPERRENKPSFSAEEQPKTINTIKPERIAKSVCQLLELPFDYPYETIYIGENYLSKTIESIPNSLTNIGNLGIDTLVVRMDFEFNEQVLMHQMQQCLVTIITNKPINIELLRAFRGRIKQLFYIIDENHDSKFAEQVQKLSIPLQLFSFLSEERLNEFKLEYIDILPIFRKETKTRANIKEICDISNDKLYYKTSKITLNQGGIFMSKAAWLAKKPVSTVNQVQSVIDHPEFWNEIDYFCLLKDVC